MQGDDSRKGKTAVVHPRVARAIAKLGEDISNARRSRKIGADDFAGRIGVSRMTLHRLETGDPGVSLNTLAMALHAIGRLDALAEIADPASDHVTMMQMKEDAPRRIVRPRQRPVAQAEHEEGAEADQDDAPPPPSPKYMGF